MVQDTSFVYSGESAMQYIVIRVRKPRRTYGGCFCSWNSGWADVEVGEESGGQGDIGYCPGVLRA